MNRKELIIKYIETLVLQFGYTKKQIAFKIGVPPVKLTNVIKAKRTDERLLDLLLEHFPELNQVQFSSTQTEDEEKGLILVKVKKLHANAQVPTKAYNEDAGYDLFAHSIERAAFQIKYHTGIAVQIPVGHVGLIFPRSSVIKTMQQMANSVGVIDAGYTGEITVVYNMICNLTQEYSPGERVGQLVIMPLPKVNIIEVKQLDESNRGENGFGSTVK